MLDCVRGVLPPLESIMCWLRASLADKKLDQAVVKILNDNKHDKIFKGNKPRTVIRVLKTRSTGTGQLMMELHDVVNNNDRVLSKLTKDLTAEQMVTVQATINQLQPKETF